MTNDEKIDKMLKFYHGTKTLKDYLLEMAEWKEQQMIDKAVKWLKSNRHIKDDVVWNIYIDNFKRTMEVE